MATAHLNDGSVLELPDDLSDEAIDFIVSQHVSALKKIGELESRIDDMAEKITAAVDRMQADIVAAVTAPKELIRDSEGRPQRVVSLYAGEVARPANQSTRPRLDDDYGHLERLPTR